MANLGGAKYQEKQQENHRNTMRKRSAKTAKHMHPCKCGALVTQSAGFEKIPEDIQIKHDNYANMYTKMNYKLSSSQK